MLISVGSFADEYDHLDYTRAGSSFKQHYHRMDKPLNITVEESDLKQNNIPAGLNNLNAPAAAGAGAAGGSNAVPPQRLCLPSTSAAAATAAATSSATPSSSASTSKTASTASTVSAASSPDDNADVDVTRLK